MPDRERSGDVCRRDLELGGVDLPGGELSRYLRGSDADLERLHIIGGYSAVDNRNDAGSVLIPAIVGEFRDLRRNIARFGYAVRELPDRERSGDVCRGNNELSVLDLAPAYNSARGDYFALCANVTLCVNGKTIVDVERSARNGATGYIDSVKGSRRNKIGDDLAVHSHSEPVFSIIAALRVAETGAIPPPNASSGLFVRGVHYEDFLRVICGG